jgi:hypothetical protein
MRPSSSSGRGITALISGSPVASTRLSSPRSWRRSTERRPSGAARPSSTRLQLRGALTSVPASARRGRRRACLAGEGACGGAPVPLLVRQPWEEEVGRPRRRGRSVATEDDTGATVDEVAPPSPPVEAARSRGGQLPPLPPVGAHGGTPLGFLFRAGANGHWCRCGMWSRH